MFTILEYFELQMPAQDFNYGFTRASGLASRYFILGPKCLGTGFLAQRDEGGTGMVWRAVSVGRFNWVYRVEVRVRVSGQIRRESSYPSGVLIFTMQQPIGLYYYIHIKSESALSVVSELKSPDRATCAII